MATTLELASDEILKLFRETWNAGATPIAGYTPDIQFVDFTNSPGRPPPPEPKPDRAWCRVSMAHTGGGQRTLGLGTSLFENRGLITVQVFAPYKDNAGATLAQRLAAVAKQPFMGKRTPNVWFRNPRYQEVGREGVWYQINVSADYQWDERR